MAEKGGSGLNKGISEAFPGIELQADVGKAVVALERKATKLISEEAELEKKLLSEKVQKRTYEKYEKVEAETAEAVRVYDVVYILYGWLRELLAINGYAASEVKELLWFVLAELESACGTSNSLKKGW